MAISDVWHFVEGGKRAGPFTEDEMKGFVRQGRVRSDTLVWCDGMTDWMPLHLSKGAPLLLEASETVKQATPPALPGGVFYDSTTVLPGHGGPGKPMGLFEAAGSCFGKYATFSGRASRSEFWYFGLFYLLVIILSSVLAAGVGQNGELSGLVPLLIVLAFVLPNLAVAVRRLHDIDFSGWWLLIGIVPGCSIVLLVFCCLRPTPGRNRFG